MTTLLSCHRWTSRSLPVLAATLFLVTTAAGCTKRGPVRHQVTGSVTYDGKSVDYGTIIFEPDVSVGAIAPTSFARIEDGKYTTVSGEGPTTGKYKVRVIGFDKSKMKPDPAPGEIVATPSLFPEYVLDVDIPTPDNKFDIQVPSASERRRRS